ncbi:MAG TPA: hypothetical protein VHZ95_07615, partial [Polyangiales bacterium]|nr:hypothetical protein [Polyangiales bacterium]
MASKLSALAWFPVSIALLAACGSSSSHTAITITAPVKDAQLTLKNDDLDPDRDGLQYDVTATTKGLGIGAKVLLTIEGQADAAISTVDKDGTITFSGVTLPPGKHSLRVDAANGGAHSASDYDYTYAAIVIDAPHDGAAIGTADDTDAMTDGIQIVVAATSYAVEPSQDITLLVDNSPVGKTVHADSKGKIVFSGVTLATGSHSIQVEADAAESNTVQVSVNQGCAAVAFVSPMPPTDATRLTLGGGDTCPDPSSDFTIDVVISTDAGDGRNVDLKVNGTTVQSTNVSGSLAKFTNVVLNHRTSANTLSVIVQGAQNVTCKEVPFPTDIFVDCMGSDCSIGSPDPKSGLDADRQHVLYLNQSMLDQGGFDVRIDSDSTVLGNQVKLVIDRDDRDALASDPSQSGSQVSATFSGVKLSEGAHTIEGLCQDA